MIAFTPTGAVLSFAAAANQAAAVAVAVQAVTQDNVSSQQIKITNIDGTNDVVVGWGATAAAAAFAAATANGSPNCTYLMHSSVEVVTVPDQAFVTAIFVGGTPTVKVQAGYGN